MNSQIKVLNCPNCGAGLINVHEHIVKCSYCGSNVLLEFNKNKKQYEVSSYANYGYSSYTINNTREIKYIEPKKEPELNLPLFAAGMALGFPIINYD